MIDERPKLLSITHIPFSYFTFLYSMRLPRLKNFSNCQLTPSFLGTEVHVDDVVYYISPTAEYAIKKSTVIAKNVIGPSHHFRMFPTVELTLDNGDVVNAHDTFPTKEAALDYLISELEAQIQNDRNALLTLQNEIDYEERMLQLLRKKEQGWH